MERVKNTHNGSGTLLQEVDEQFTEEVFIDYKKLHEALGKNNVVSNTGLLKFLEESGVKEGKIGRTRVFELDSAVRKLIQKKFFRNKEVDQQRLKKLRQQLDEHYLPEQVNFGEGINVSSPTKRKSYSRTSPTTSLKVDQQLLEGVQKSLLGERRKVAELQKELAEKVDQQLLEGVQKSLLGERRKVAELQKELAEKVEQQLLEGVQKSLLVERQKVAELQKELAEKVEQLESSQTLVDQLKLEKEVTAKFSDPEYTKEINEKVQQLSFGNQNLTNKVSKLITANSELEDGKKTLTEKVQQLEIEVAEKKEEVLDFILDGRTNQKSWARSFFTSVHFKSMFIIGLTIVSGTFYFTELSDVIGLSDDAKGFITLAVCGTFACGLPYVGFNPSKNIGLNERLKFLIIFGEIFCAFLFFGEKEFDWEFLKFIRIGILSIINASLLLYVFAEERSKTLLSMEEISTYLYKINETLAKTTVPKLKELVVEDINKNKGTKWSWKKWRGKMSPSLKKKI